VSPFLHAELHADHRVIITVSGVVAHQDPDQIPGAVRAAIVRWAPRVVLLDVADVSLLDAGTIAALLAGHQTGAWAGVPVALINIGAFPLSQLRAHGVASLLCPDLPAAEDGAVADLYAPSSPLLDEHDRQIVTYTPFLITDPSPSTTGTAEAAGARDTLSARA
jgi:hypothetical protein